MIIRQIQFQETGFPQNQNKDFVHFGLTNQHTKKMSEPENPFSVNEDSEEYRARVNKALEAHQLLLESRPVTKTELDKLLTYKMEELERKRITRCIQRLWFGFWVLVGLAIFGLGLMIITEMTTHPLLVSVDSSVHNVSMKALNHGDHVHRELMFELNFKIESQSKTCRNVDIYVTMDAYHQKYWVIGRIFSGTIGVFDQKRLHKLHNHVSLAEKTDVYDTELAIRYIVKCPGHHNAVNLFTFQTPKWSGYRKEWD